MPCRVYCWSAHYTSQDTINYTTRNVVWREAIIKTLITVHQGTHLIHILPWWTVIKALLSHGTTMHNNEGPCIHNATNGHKHARANKHLAITWRPLPWRWSKVVQQRAKSQVCNKLKHWGQLLTYDFAACYKMFGKTKHLLPGLLMDSADYHPPKE